MAKPPTANAAPTAEEIDFNDYETVNKAILKAIENWQEEQVGFPPYWNPEKVGKIVLGKVVMKDESDEDFIRYVMQATQVPIPCKKGPADRQIDVVVQPGQYFTMSAYAALPLEQFFDIEVAIIVANKRKLPATEESDGVPRDLWEFQLKVPPESKKLLNARRTEQAKLLQETRIKRALEAAEKQAASAPL